MEIGQIVVAVLPEDRQRFGKLLNTEVYRIGGVVKGNSGEVKSVRIVGVAGYWPVEMFQPVPADMLERLVAKVQEFEELGEGKLVAKSVRVALENCPRSNRLKGITADDTPGVSLEDVEMVIEVEET